MTAQLDLFAAPLDPAKSARAEHIRLLLATLRKSSLKADPYVVADYEAELRELGT